MLAFQLSSFVVYLVIVFSWIIPKKLNVKKSVIFFLLLVCVGISVTLDCFSTYFSYSDVVATEIKNLFFKLHLISLVICGYFNFAYLVGKSVELNLKRKIAQFSIVVPIVFIVLIAILPIYISKTDGGLEVNGGSILCAYICAAIFFAMIVAVFVVTKSKINKWFRACFIVSALTWTLAALFQVFSEMTGILSIAFIASMVAIFIFIENPLNYINHDFNCFKNNFLYSFVDDVIKNEKGGLAIYVDLNYSKETDDNEFINKMKKNFIKAFNEYKDTRLFINENNNIYIISRVKENFKKYKVLVDRLVDECYNSFKDDNFDNNFFRAEVVYCNNIKLFNYADEFVSYVKKSQEKLLRISGYFASHEITSEEIEIERKEEIVKEEITKALNEDRVEAFVQPIYSVKKGKIVSAEALCRIRNVDGSLMLPYQFIPVSEKCGLDISIGYRMIEKICQFLIDPILGGLFEYVDINLSIAQCERIELAKSIINITQRYNIDPNRLNFEITESGFINKLSNIERNIRLLTDYGFGFSLDDFGSGESNLDYLVEMPVKYLKLDMHMIWAYFENERAKKTVQSIIKISHDMNLEVIAEGVENKEQLDELSSQGADFIQGYYFFKPMTINEYLQNVNAKNENKE